MLRNCGLELRMPTSGKEIKEVTSLNLNITRYGNGRIRVRFHVELSEDKNGPGPPHCAQDFVLWTYYTAWLLVLYPLFDVLFSMRKTFKKPISGLGFVKAGLGYLCTVQTILDTVCSEINKVYALFCQRYAWPFSLEQRLYYQSSSLIWKPIFCPLKNNFPFPHGYPPPSSFPPPCELFKVSLWLVKLKVSRAVTDRLQLPL